MSEFLGLLGLPCAYIADEQILGYHCSGPTGPTLGLPCQQPNPLISLLWAYRAHLGPTLPTIKSLDIIAIGLLGLHWAYLANEQILGYHWAAPTGPTLLFWVVIDCGSILICSPMFETRFMLMIFFWTLFTNQSLSIMFNLCLICLVCIHVGLSCRCFHVRNSVYLNEILIICVYKSMTLHVFLWLFRCFRFRPTEPTWGLPCQRANPWMSVLWAYWACPGLTLPTSKSLDIIALGLLGLPWACLANDQMLA